MDPAAPSQRQSAEVNAQDFILEIRTEEIPAPALLPARLELARASADALAGEGLAPASIESYATLRRLVLVLRGLPERQEDRFAEVLGPPASNAFDEDGKPTRAAQGLREGAEGRRRRARRGRLAAGSYRRRAQDHTGPRRRRGPRRGAPAGRRRPVVSEDDALGRGRPLVRAARARRRGAPRRPDRSSRALRRSGGRPDDGSPRPLGRGDRRDRAGRLSRQAPHGASSSPTPRFAGSRSSRRPAPLAAEVGGQIEAHADLANTLADLVEWPGLVRGAFAPEFLELPEEITVTVMRTHQKFLPVRGPGGLLPHFVAVMDNDDDRKGFIAKGCEWVLNARLADARFFYEEDAQESLEARLPKLSRLTFQEKLGDYRQKTARLQDLAEAIARAGRPRGARRGGAHGGAAVEGGPDDASSSRNSRTSRESSAGIYARRERRPGLGVEGDLRPVPSGLRLGRSAARGLGRDPLARRPVRLALRPLPRSGLVPTGSKDPYGLRRAALGVVSIAIGAQLANRLAPGRAEGAVALSAAGRRARAPKRSSRSSARFFADRLRSLLERRGSTYDEISAVLNVGVWDFADVGRPRAGALGGPPAHGFPVAHPRRSSGSATSSATTRPARRRPSSTARTPSARSPSDFLQARQAIDGFATERHYREAMETIASIAPSLDRFFVDVLVNCPGRGPAPQPAGAARLDSARIHAPGGLFRNRGGKMKRVFSFGNGVAEGAGLGKETLGGKGAGLAEMTALGIPVPPGFTIETSVCADFSRGASLDGDPRARSSRRSRKLEHDTDKRFGDPDEPAARLGPVGRALLDARDDGHDPEPRPDLAHGQGPRRASRATASRSTAGAASSRCTATSCCACRATSSRRR